MNFGNDDWHGQVYETLTVWCHSFLVRHTGCFEGKSWPMQAHMLGCCICNIKKSACFLNLISNQWGILNQSPYRHIFISVSSAHQTKSCFKKANAFQGVKRRTAGSSARVALAKPKTPAHATAYQQSASSCRLSTWGLQWGMDLGRSLARCRSNGTNAIQEHCL